MSSLSVVIITKNESETIADCLNSVTFADEIIVVDSGSTDGTVEYCRNIPKVKVLECDWPGDGPQRNRGIDIATKDWILCLDADERVTPELGDEIQTLLRSNSLYQGYDIPFLSHYLGRPMYYGDWRNESHIRLFKRQFGRYSKSDAPGAQGAHCRPLVDGKVGKLRNKIYHYPFPTLDKMLTKLNSYSTGSAHCRLYQGKKGGLGRALGHGVWTFIRGYIIKAGFLDGREGFILALSNAHGAYYRYLKLFYLSQASAQA